MPPSSAQNRRRTAGAEARQAAILLARTRDGRIKNRKVEKECHVGPDQLRHAHFRWVILPSPSSCVL